MATLERIIRLGIDSSGAVSGAATWTQSTGKIESSTRRTRDELGRFIKSPTGIRGLADKIRNEAKPAFDRFIADLRRTGTHTKLARNELGQFIRGRNSVDELQRKLNKIGSGSIGKLAGAFRSAKLALGGLGLGAGFGLTAVFNVIKNFEKEMSNVKALVGDITDNEFKAMEAEARRLGATTRFSATEAASGLKFLSLAGFESRESIAALEPTLNLAAAGAIDLGNAADIASNIATQFGIKAENLNRVVDTLAFTASKSNTNIEQLSEALKFAGPIASVAGIELEEVAAAAAQLGNAGIQAGLAGTGLRRVMINLSSPTESAVAAFADMDLSLSDLDLRTNSLTEVMAKLGNANLNVERASKIFGDRAAGVAVILARTSAKTADFEKRIRSAQGAAKRMADTMSDNLFGASKNLISVIQELILQTGDGGLTGAFRTMLDTTTSVLRVWAGMGESLGKNRRQFTTLADRIVVLAKTLGALASLQFAAKFLVPIAAQTAAAALGFARLTLQVRGFASAAAVAGTASGKLATALGLAPTPMTKILSIGFSLITMWGLYKTATAGAFTETRSLLDEAENFATTFGKQTGKVGEAMSRNVGNKVKELKEKIARDAITADDLVRPDVAREVDARLRSIFGRTQFPEDADNGEEKRAGVERTILRERSEAIQTLRNELGRYEVALRLVDEANSNLASNTAAREEIEKEHKAFLDAEASAAAFQLRMDTATVKQDVYSQVLELSITKQERFEEATKAINFALKENEISVEDAARVTEIFKDKIFGATKESKEFSSVLQAIRTPADDYADSLLLVNEALERNVINEAQAARATEVFAKRFKDATDKIAAGPPLAREFGDAMGKTLTSMVFQAQDAEAAFKNLALQIAEMIFQATIVEPLVNSIVGAFTGGIGSLFGGGLANGPQGLGSAPGGGSFNYQIAPLGSAMGGDFKVGGGGGTDSQLVQFMASPDESVHVRTPGQRAAMSSASSAPSSGGGGGGINLRVDVVNNSSTASPTKTETSVVQTAQNRVMITNTVTDVNQEDITRRGRFARTMEQQSTTRFTGGER